MPINPDPTVRQTDPDRRRAQQLSLRRTHPPTQVRGYECVRFLGEGAYGEVWVALDTNTGRQVAIKFYTHRGGLDWSLLSREVEKLRFLFADRYVVQLLDVGWDSEPPYYVMEYVEEGSLADYVEEHGPLPAETALQLFRDVVIGLVHAHAKGVLHCDLKPANVLVDQDFRGRLADFGQARLSTEQSPALGTMFYMAPEQADLTAVPEATWDVYALGALLYCMLTGAPPHRSDAAQEEIERPGNLEERLSRYRRWITEAAAPAEHRNVPGVDRPLADLINRCLSVDPKRRPPNAQAVLDELDLRTRRKLRRPLLVMGAIGPLLLLLVFGLFAWRGFQAAVAQSREALTDRALTTNHFAAQSVAKAVAYDIDKRYQAVERLAQDPLLQQELRKATAAMTEVIAGIHASDSTDQDRLDLAVELVRHPGRRALQQRLSELAQLPLMPDAHSWFVTDARGTQLARWPIVHDLQTGDGLTVGRNYAWRSYFHGGVDDFPPDPLFSADSHVEQSQLSAVLRSQATGQWIVAVSTPVVVDGEFLGVAALTVGVGQFTTFDDRQDQFWVLVDNRPGRNQGVILQHRLFHQYAEKSEPLPAGVEKYRVPAERLPSGNDDFRIEEAYRDPLGDSPWGSDYGGRWLAAMAPVTVQDSDTQLVAIVQEKHEAAVNSVGRLAVTLRWMGLGAVGVFGGVLSVLWAVVAFGMRSTSRRWGLLPWVQVEGETNGHRSTTRSVKTSPPSRRE